MKFDSFYIKLRALPCLKWNCFFCSKIRELRRSYKRIHTVALDLRVLTLHQSFWFGAFYNTDYVFQILRLKINVSAMTFNFMLPLSSIFFLIFQWYFKYYMEIEVTYRMHWLSCFCFLKYLYIKSSLIKKNHFKNNE